MICEIEVPSSSASSSLLLWRWLWWFSKSIRCKFCCESTLLVLEMSRPDSHKIHGGCSRTTRLCSIRVSQPRWANDALGWDFDFFSTLITFNLCPITMYIVYNRLVEATSCAALRALFFRSSRATKQTVTSFWHLTRATIIRQNRTTSWRHLACKLLSTCRD
jgi:hypothetical protein